MDTPRTRQWAWRGLALILVVVVAITFWPTPVDQPVHRTLGRLLASLHRAGMPHWITYSVVESTSNVIMFVPLGVLIAILALPSLWWVSGLFGLIMSLTIELAQALFLPQRFASAGDLAANAGGALLGGGIIFALRYISSRRAT